MKTKVFINGKIYVDKGVFAQAAIFNTLIRAIGDNQTMLDLAGDAEVIDLGGRTVIPGLNDSHLHMFMKGSELLQVNTAAAVSIDDLVERCRAYLAEHPERCRTALSSIGWNQDKFTEGERRMPNRHDLDRISTEIPVVLSRVCGHVVSANSRAIELIGLGKKPKQPESGTIFLEPDGTPSGIFTENFGEQIYNKFSVETRDELISAFVTAQDYALSRGLTSVQSNDVGQCTFPMDDVFDMLKEIYLSGKGKIRYRHQICVKSEEELIYYIENERRNGRYDQTDMLSLGPLKLFKDGSLGGRTALMRREYADDPGNFGVTSIDDEKFERICKIAADAGIQVVTHAIGDGAIERVVKSYEKINAGGENALRHGIVHCQITDGELMRRIADGNLLIMYQPVFLDYDMHVVKERCGEALASTSYAFGTAMELGIHVSFGTDSPVEDCDPFANIYHAVTRKDKRGYPDGGFYPGECISVEDAIDAYTVGSAYNEFKEGCKGRIMEGYFADFVVLDRDIFTIPKDEIKDISPVMTIIGGKIVYQK